MALFNFGSQDDIDALAAEFEELRLAEGPRLRRMEEYRKELEATRDTDLDSQVGATDYGRRRQGDPEFRRHRFNFPLGRSLTVKHSNRIAGRMPDAVVERREESQEERHRSSTMEKMWWAVTRESNGDTQFADASWDGSELGASVFEMEMDPDKQIPCYRALDPMGCIVVKGVSDPHDFERVYRWWQVPIRSLQAQYRNRMLPGEIPVDINGIQASANGMVTVVQTSNRNEWVRFTLGTSAGKVITRKKNVPLMIQNHRYGFTPYVVIPNLGPYRDVWGWADYEFVREMIRYIAVHFGREADILRAVAAGAMKAKGLKISATQIKRLLAEGGIIPTGREGELDPVEVPQVPAFAENHAERMIDFMERLGFAPAAAWGNGASGSGSDRGLQLAPMFELTSMKQKNWASGLSRLGEMAFRMIESQTTKPVRYRGSVPGPGRSRRPFAFTVAPNADPVATTVPDSDGIPTESFLPMTPRELFDGDYEINFTWQNRIDVDDPAFVNTELQKFAQGVQSLHTTLERLGFEAPEDEIALIDKEAEMYPWIRDGMLKMIEMQLNASQQGQGGGQPFDQSKALADAGQMMQTKDGSALDGDATASALQGGIGTLYGGA